MVEIIKSNTSPISPWLQRRSTGHAPQKKERPNEFHNCRTSRELERCRDKATITPFFGRGQNESRTYDQRVSEQSECHACSGRRNLSRLQGINSTSRTIYDQLPFTSVPPAHTTLNTRE